MERFDNISASSPYAEAMRSVRAARRVFATLLLLAIILQVAGFVLINFAGVLDARFAGASSPQPTATQPGDVSTPAHAESSADLHGALVWQDVLGWVLPATKFVAMACAILLSLTLLLAVKLSLIGQLGGIAKFTSAFFWSLLLLMTVTPWQQVLGGSFASGLCEVRRVSGLGAAGLVCGVRQVPPRRGCEHRFSRSVHRRRAARSLGGMTFRH